MSNGELEILFTRQWHKRASDLRRATPREKESNFLFLTFPKMNTKKPQRKNALFFSPNHSNWELMLLYHAPQLTRFPWQINNPRLSYLKPNQNQDATSTRFTPDYRSRGRKN